MQTVLLVSRMEVGRELAVREAHDRFPDSLDRASGVRRLVAFVGSGIYALEVTVADGDFQQNFARFLDHPAIKALFDEVRSVVPDLPSGPAPTASLPLATAMLVWQSDSAGDATSV